ncbi:hypothetical protein MMC18_003639 [Xylographa bjoerkii]|nr:hypothetical protein [Xylographa bjoerkii]
MATAYAPQQPQPMQGPPGGGPPSPEDPLLTALQQYITTGPDATHITTKDLRKLYDESVADMGSKVYLEKFLTSTPTISLSSWENEAEMSGIISISKTKFSFTLMAPSIHVSTIGQCFGLFVSGETSIVGKLWFNDLTSIVPGEGDFEMNVRSLNLYINFYRDQEYIATFVGSPIGFTMAPGIKKGTNTWS